MYSGSQKYDIGYYQARSQKPKDGGQHFATWYSSDEEDDEVSFQPVGSGLKGLRGLEDSDEIVW